MKEHQFEYTDQHYTLKLLGVCFLVFGLLLFAMKMTIPFIGILGSTLLALIIPIIIFWINRKRILQSGSATIHDTYTTINLSNRSDKIAYADIKYYQVESYNGALLKIKLIDGKKYKLMANSLFSNPEQLNLFFAAFDNAVQEFNTVNHNEIVRKKSIFEQRWMFPFLIVLSACVIGGIIVANTLGKSQPGTAFYTLLILLASLWLGYISAGKKKD